jgi:endonuclease-3
MQFELLAFAENAAVAVHNRLRKFYQDEIVFEEPLHPPYQLVLSILSSRTKGAVSAATFDRLMKYCNDLSVLSTLKPGMLLPIVADVTFPDVKAAHIPAALRAIKLRRGTLDLWFLKRWRPDVALDWLERLPGVGPKIAAAVLNFSALRMRALVVDTHHFRVADRIGLLPSMTAFHNAARFLERQLPQTWDYRKIADHHRLMKRHGQEFCRASGPRCGLCPVRDLCGSNVGGRTELIVQRNAAVRPDTIG